MEGGYFDLSGRTVDARLKRENDTGVSFMVGDTYVFGMQNANDLEKLGVVTLGSRIFVRPLNDYEFGFRDFRRLTVRAIQDLLLLNRELAETIRSKSVTDEQEIVQGKESVNLKLDKSQYFKVLYKITSETENLTEQINAKKSELSQIYATIIALHGNLLDQSRELSAIANSLAPSNP